MSCISRNARRCQRRTDERPSSAEGGIRGSSCDLQALVATTTARPRSLAAVISGSAAPWGALQIYGGGRHFTLTGLHIAPLHDAISQIERRGIRTARANACMHGEGRSCMGREEWGHVSNSICLTGEEMMMRHSRWIDRSLGPLINQFIMRFICESKAGLLASKSVP